MAHSTPHYLRFAQALALVSGIAAPMSGCAMQHSTTDAGASDAPSTSDAPIATSDTPYVDPCATCECVFGGDTPPPPGSCEAAGTPECCYAVGPLAPPDLPA